MCSWAFGLLQRQTKWADDKFGFQIHPVPLSPAGTASSVAQAQRASLLPGSRDLCQTSLTGLTSSVDISSGFQDSWSCSHLTPGCQLKAIFAASPLSSSIGPRKGSMCNHTMQLKHDIWLYFCIFEPISHVFPCSCPQ